MKKVIPFIILYFLSFALVAQQMDTTGLAAKQQALYKKYTYRKTAAITCSVITGVGIAGYCILSANRPEKPANANAAQYANYDKKNDNWKEGKRLIAIGTGGFAIGAIMYYIAYKHSKALHENSKVALWPSANGVGLCLYLK